MQAGVVWYDEAMCPRSLANFRFVRRACTLVVPHKSWGKKNYKSGPNAFHAVGQVVNSLQPEPECLRAGLCRSSDDVAAQRSNHADHLIQRWRLRRRILLTNGHVDGFPFTRFEDDFAVEVWALTAKVTQIHDLPRDD